MYYILKTNAKTNDSALQVKYNDSKGVTLHYTRDGDRTDRTTSESTRTFATVSPYLRRQTLRGMMTKRRRPISHRHHLQRREPVNTEDSG